MKPLFILFSAAAFLTGAVGAESTPEIQHGSDRFTFSYDVTLPGITGAGCLWAPLAGTDAFQDVKIDRVSAPGEWRKINDQSGKNDVLVMPLSGADAGKHLVIDYIVERREKGAYPAKEDPSRFLKPDRLIPDSGAFDAIAKKLIAEKPDALEQGRALYDYVLSTMKYDKSGTGWGCGDALYAMHARHGNCTDFHSLFIALARAAGIPARFSIGFSIPADRGGGTVAGYHCWAEFLANGKWVPVDISEAWKNPRLADYYFGHNPANRFELSRGRDLIVEPAPASGPINFLVYPLIEINGAPLKAETEFSFTRLKS